MDPPSPLPPPANRMSSARRDLGGLILGELLLCYDIRGDFYCLKPLSSVAIVALAYHFFFDLSLFLHLFHLALSSLAMPRSSIRPGRMSRYTSPRPMAEHGPIPSRRKRRLPPIDWAKKCTHGLTMVCSRRRLPRIDWAKKVNAMATAEPYGDFVKELLYPFAQPMHALRRAYTVALNGGATTLGVKTMPNIKSRPYITVHNEGLIYPFAESMHRLRRALETIVRSCVYVGAYSKLKTEAADLLTTLNIVLCEGICGDAAASVYKFLKSGHWELKLAMMAMILPKSRCATISRGKRHFARSYSNHYNLGYLQAIQNENVDENDYRRRSVEAHLEYMENHPFDSPAREIPTDYSGSHDSDE